MYKIIHGLLYFPSDVFSTRIGRTPSTIRPFLYHCPFARTSCFQHSYVPHTINVWNTLPLSVVDTTFSSFKNRTWDHICIAVSLCYIMHKPFIEKKKKQINQSIRDSLAVKPPPTLSPPTSHCLVTTDRPL